MSNNTCIGILKSGKNKGEKCGSKCLSNSEYCKRHTVSEIEEKTSDSIIKKTVKSKEKTEISEKQLKIKKTIKSKEKEEKQETSLKVNVYNPQKIQAKRNDKGNYVLSNDLIVHPVNKNIIGRQDGEKIIELSIEDIEYCKEHGFRYVQPSVLYFADSDNEKKEVDLLKHMLKTKNNDKNDDELDEYEESENEISDDENDD